MFRERLVKVRLAPSGRPAHCMVPLNLSAYSPLSPKTGKGSVVDSFPSSVTGSVSFSALRAGCESTGRFGKRP